MGGGRVGEADLGGELGHVLLVLCRRLGHLLLDRLVLAQQLRRQVLAVLGLADAHEAEAEAEVSLLHV